MADININYKGSKIAELSGTGKKTLNTSGKYCEGDIEVNYTPNCRSYEITLTKASGWVLLTTLDSDVLEHINDDKLVVSLSCISGYVYEYYSYQQCIVSNTPGGYYNKYPVYGMGLRENSPTSAIANSMYYPPNKTDTSVSIGGFGAFRLSGDKYYYIPGDGFIRTGTYRLTFTW